MFRSELVTRLSTQITRWPLVEQVLAEVGAEEAGAAGDDGGGHAAIVRSGLAALTGLNFSHSGALRRAPRHSASLTPLLSACDVVSLANLDVAGESALHAIPPGTRSPRRLVCGLRGSALAAKGRLRAQPVTPGYAGSVLRALWAKHDVWGNDLIARPNGPTYAAVRRLLKPLLFARSKGEALTTSGVYYLPFAQPLGRHGRADGRAPRRRRKRDPLADREGAEPEGLRRRGRPRALRLVPVPPGRAKLAEGYLPILETQYVDAGGTRYRQESFAVRGLGTGDLVSFVRLTADARHGKGAVLRLVPEGSRRGARVAQGTMRHPGRGRRARTLYGGWLVPFGGAPGRDRRADLRRRPRSGSSTSGSPGSAQPIVRRPREGRQQRPAEPLDPGPRADLAVQRRQPVRGVLVRRGARRRRGDGRVRAPRRRRRRSCAARWPACGARTGGSARS